MLAAGLVVFSWVHALLGQDERLAHLNAASLVAVETRLGIHHEATVNGWLVAHPMLIPPAVVTYRLYYVLVCAVLVWLLVRHPEAVRRLVRVMLLMGLLALVSYWLFPLAPPRLALPEVTDVVASHDLFRHDPSAPSTGNHNSAMPSMHVGWTAWCAYAIATTHATGRRPSCGSRAWPWLLPTIMVAVVISTGHHYVLDVVGSAFVLAFAVAAESATHTRVGPHPVTTSH